MNPSRHQMPALPTELWLSIFYHATHVPGALIPDVYVRASLIGSISCNIALRKSLTTKHALVLVCRQWWHLAIPSLYTSAYIGRARCLSLLSNTLVRSAVGKGIIVGARPLGEYIERLDIAVHHGSENVDAEYDSLATLIACMPRLAIVSFAISPKYYHGIHFPNSVVDALHSCAATLRVLDWFSSPLEPSASRVDNLLAKCTQLRVLNCPRLLWSRELQHGGIPLTVTTLRLHAFFPTQITTASNNSHFDPNPTCRSGPSALQELILDLNCDVNHWRGLLEVYGPQLVSVHFYISSVYSTDVDGHLQLLAELCPTLPRLTITSAQFTSFAHPHLVFPSITYLGLRTTRPQSPKPDFEALFGVLGELRSSMPSLRVVQLLNERNVQCLLWTHTKFAVRALQPFINATPFRVEDEEGVLLTDRLKELGYL